MMKNEGAVGDALILYSNRESFIVSLKVKNEGENIEIATGIENRMNHRLELVFNHILSKYIDEAPVGDALTLSRFSNVLNSVGTL
jgi:hypothetical protein